MTPNELECYLVVSGFIVAAVNLPIAIITHDGWANWYCVFLGVAFLVAGLTSILVRRSRG